MKRSSYLAAATLMVSALSVPASEPLAQQLTLEEIVVTARKVEENLMEVPLAITAFTAEELEAIDMAQLEDIQLYTPSFSFTNMQGGSARNDRSSNSLVFRGLTLASNVNITAGGMLFIDGAPVIGARAPSVVDTERVEILKGPQSAYFGRSTFVGAINFIMKEPGDEFGGSASAEYSRFGSNEQNISIEGPVVPGKLNARVSGRHWHQGGYVENFANPSVSLGERTTNSISTSLVFTPADDLKIKAFVNYFEDSDGAATQFSLKQESFNGRANPDRSCSPIGSPLQAGVTDSTGRASFGYVCGKLPGARDVDPSIFSADTVLDPILRETLFNPNPNWLVYDPSFNTSAGIKRKAFQANIRVDYENSAGYAFTSLTAYHTDKNQNIIDLNYRDGRSLANPFAGLFIGVFGRTDIRPDWNTTLLIQGKQKDWSQELRVVSPQDGRMRWTAGFNYLYAHSPGSSVYGNLIIGPFFTSAITQRDVRTPSVFGAAYFDLTDKLTLSAEARYQWDKISNLPIINTQGLPANAAEVSNTFKSFAPRVSLDYNYSDNSTVYALFSRGFRPGGFNTVLTTASQAVLDALRQVVPSAGVNFDEEKLDNYEIGIKSTWLDGRARTTLALYYDEWLNGQVRNSIPIVADGVANLVGLTINNGAAELKGIEFEAQLQATENFTLSGTFGYNDTEVKAFVCGDCNLVYGTFDGVVGNRLPSAPKYTWNISAAYEDELFGDYDWYSRIDYAHQGNRMVDYSNVAWTSPYDNFNVRLGIRSDLITVEAFVLNATNNDEFLQGTLGVDLFTFIRGPNRNEVRVGAPIPR
ncbi:MAG: TonB-dependent receptor, partial [Rhodospirillaceae bacterium]